MADDDALCNRSIGTDLWSAQSGSVPLAEVSNKAGSNLINTDLLFGK
jgi:hypothetical protein